MVTENEIENGWFTSLGIQLNRLLCVYSGPLFLHQMLDKNILWDDCWAMFNVMKFWGKENRRVTPLTYKWR